MFPPESVAAAPFRGHPIDRPSADMELSDQPPVSIHRDLEICVPDPDLAGNTHVNVVMSHARCFRKLERGCQPHKSSVFVPLVKRARRHQTGRERRGASSALTSRAVCGLDRRAQRCSVPGPEHHAVEREQQRRQDENGDQKSLLHHVLNGRAPSLGSSLRGQAIAPGQPAIGRPGPWSVGKVPVLLGRSSGAMAQSPSPPATVSGIGHTRSRGRRPFVQGRRAGKARS